MNYIKEINGFYQRQETEQLSTSASNLWHVLMHVNNRIGWKRTFSVAVSVLSYKASLSNSTFKRARRELEEKGYIRYESQGGSRAAIYEMVPFDDFMTRQKDESLDDHISDLNDNFDNQASKQVTKDHSSNDKMKSKLVDDELRSNLQTDQTIHVDHKHVPFFKQDETKQNISASAECVTFFQNNIGKMNSYLKSDLEKWVHRLSKPLVLAAMKRGIDRGQGNWGYIKAILQDWFTKDFKTVADIEDELEKFQKSKQSRYTKTNQHLSITENNIPDWFEHRHKKQALRKPDTIEETKERESLADLIATFA